MGQIANLWRDLGTNNVTVEVMVIKDQATPVAFHHVHESVPDGEAARAWYMHHIGFEVKDLDATLKRLGADGVTINMPLRDMTKQIGLKIAFITDPYGTCIELTEGLASK